MRGDHSVTLRGRSYHYLRNPRSAKGGINYFTFDATEALDEHADGLLATQTRGSLRAMGPKIIKPILKGIRPILFTNPTQY